MKVGKELLEFFQICNEGKYAIYGPQVYPMESIVIALVSPSARWSVSPLVPWSVRL